MVTSAPVKVNRIAQYLDPVAPMRDFDDEIEMSDRRSRATEPNLDSNVVIWAINFVFMTFPEARREVEQWPLRQIVAFATDLL